MLKTLFTILAAIAAAALMSVCPTLVEARSAKGACLSHEYTTSTDAVWKALPRRQLYREHIHAQ